MGGFSRWLLESMSGAGARLRKNCQKKRNTTVMFFSVKGKNK